jgi:hypothetical protein
MSTHQETASTAAAKLSPPAAVLGAHILGMSVADWIQWLTLFYLILLVVHKLWSMWKELNEYWFVDKDKP